ncbi:MAG: hypothetical protein JWO65_1338 [Sphingomonas bacterium]|nr:hypothetical protein [Sphingomonas bacterium]
MADVDTKFIVEMLQGIRSDISDIKRDLHRVEIRQTAVEGHLSSVVISLQIMREQTDEMRDDVRLIKRRLDLVDAH